MKNKSVKLPFITKNSTHLVRTICSQMTSETISDSAECYAGLLVHFESSPACI